MGSIKWELMAEGVLGPIAHEGAVGKGRVYRLITHAY